MRIDRFGSFWKDGNDPLKSYEIMHSVKEKQCSVGNEKAGTLGDNGGSRSGRWLDAASPSSE